MAQTISEWLFSGGCRSTWSDLAKRELEQSKPVPGRGIWNSTREDCEKAAAVAIQREIVYVMAYHNFPFKHMKESEIISQMEAIARELVASAIQETPWWMDSGALEEGTGLRHSDAS